MLYRSHWQRYNIEPDKLAVTVEVGNHQIVLSQPELPQTYSLESLRQSEVMAFDDPLAIAAQFLQTADVLTEEMQRDIRVREQKLQQTQQAKAAIAEKATAFKLEARLYRERTAMLATAQSQETQSLQQSLTTLQNLGKPPPSALQPGRCSLGAWRATQTEVLQTYAYTLGVQLMGALSFSANCYSKRNTVERSSESSLPAPSKRCLR